VPDDHAAVLAIVQIESHIRTLIIIPANQAFHLLGTLAQQVLYIRA
jgi:hypothetical protein